MVTIMIRGRPAAALHIPPQLLCLLQFPLNRSLDLLKSWSKSDISTNIPREIFTVFCISYFEDDCFNLHMILIDLLKLFHSLFVLVSVPP